MNADQITKALEKVDSEATGNRLHNECHARIEEIKRRIADISPGHPIYGDPPARQHATLKGDAAIHSLEQEITALGREQDRLSQLAGICIEAGHKAETDRLAAELPRAANRLPSMNRAVSKAIDQLIAAMAEHTAVMTALNNYQVVGAPRPLDDAQLAEVLRIRERLWTLPALTTMAPSPEDAEAARLYYVMRGPRDSPTVYVRPQHQSALLVLDNDPVTRIPTKAA